MDCHPIQGLFPCCAKCSCDRLQIHHDPDQDKSVSFSRTKYILTGANVLQKLLVVTQSEVQHVIQEHMKELQDLRHNADVLKVSSGSTVLSSTDLSIAAICW